MLDTELLDETGREDTGSESATEDGRELGVKSSDTHVFELEVGSENGIGRGPESKRAGQPQRKKGRGRVDALLRARLDLDGALRVLDEVDLGLPSDDAGPSLSRSAVEREGVEGLDGTAEVLTVEVEDERLSDGEDQSLVGADEDGLELVRRVSRRLSVLLEPVADL